LSVVGEELQRRYEFFSADLGFLNASNPTWIACSVSGPVGISFIVVSIEVVVILARAKEM